MLTAYQLKEDITVWKEANHKNALVNYSGSLEVFGILNEKSEAFWNVSVEWDAITHAQK